MTKSILYIDDDPVNVFVMQRMLKDFELDVAYSPEEGFRFAMDKPFDIIMLDMNFGKGQESGSLLQKRLRQSGYREAKIVAVTASTMDGDREQILAEGFDGYFSKPIRREELIEYLRSED